MNTHETTTVAPGARLAPLVLATAAAQSLLVVLAPTIVQIADDLGVSPGAVGQARAVTAVTAILGAATTVTRTQAVGVPRLLRLGAALATVACAWVAAAPTLEMFLAGHVLLGLGFACLLTAGFTGVAAFPAHRRARALGRVAATNAATWILVSPIAGVLTDLVSWRAAQLVPAVIAAAAILAAGSSAPAPGQPTTLSLRGVLATPSARRWISAELVAYAGWAAFLTFNGAFLIQGLGLPETTAGMLLAIGPACYVAAATGSGRLLRLASRRVLVAAAAAAMAVLLPALLAVSQSVVAAAVLSGLVGTAAGIRTPLSAGLGLDQLPRHPATMMTARTALTQAGYLLGAVAGGALIAGGGYQVLGIALGVTLAISAALVLRVRV